VGAIGLEPTTFAMSTQRSNQLSYAPKGRNYIIVENWAAALYFFPSVIECLFPLAMSPDLLVEPLSSQLGVEHYAAPLHAPLDAFVEVVWSVKGRTYYQRETVLPNGGIEFMLNFGSTQRVLAYGSQKTFQEHKHYWIAGLQNQPLTIEASGESHLVSIRFRPGGAHALFGLPIEEINNQVVDLDLLLGRAISELHARLAAVADFRTRVEVIEDWLLNQLAPREYEHRLVSRAVATLQDSAGRKPVAELCQDLGLSNKHMITLFRRLVGLPPKSMARIMRFHNLIDAVKFERDVDWARLAANHSYYDQSHLIREFHKLGGVTPEEYIARRTPEGVSLHTD
jgi:AraC-like DNA-binding protein